MAYLDNTGLAQVWFKVCARIDSKVEGAKGKSLYQSWLDSGQTGSEADFVEDMKGEPGKKGDTGKSAYDLWKEQGNEGTVTDFLNAQKGAPGKSNYDLWKEQGNNGTLQDFLLTLKGEKGDDGKSDYQLWQEAGHTGSFEEYMKQAKGKQGDPGEAGKSAYQLWLEEGHSGSKAEFLASLKGEKGDPMQVVARTVALDASGWSPDKRRTVTVEGVTASNHIIVSPAPESMEAAGKAGLYAVAQAAGSLTFACSKVPEGFVNINVLIL